MLLPDWLQITIDLLGALIHFVGLLLLGVAAGWLTLEFLRKAQQAWQLQIAIYLGFALLAYGMTRILSPASGGGFGIGIGLAMLFWGLPRKEKKDDK